MKKVKFEEVFLREDIALAGYSIRGLARKLGTFSESTLRRWLKAGEMPAVFYQQIGQTIYGESFKTDKRIPPRSKTVWMRIGVTVKLTEDELYDIMTRNHADLEQQYFGSRKTRIRDDLMDDYDLTQDEAEKFLKRAVADGDSYIPDSCFDAHLDWWIGEKSRRKNSK